MCFACFCQFAAASVADGLWFCRAINTIRTLYVIYAARQAFQLDRYNPDVERYCISLMFAVKTNLRIPMRYETITVCVCVSHWIASGQIYAVQYIIYSIANWKLHIFMYRKTVKKCTTIHRRSHRTEAKTFDIEMEKACSWIAVQHCTTVAKGICVIWWDLYATCSIEMDYLQSARKRKTYLYLPSTNI